MSTPTDPANISVVFFGSGPVAAKSLELLARNFHIEAVVTKPQPDHHKEAFPVLQLAHTLGLQTFTPTNKAELTELFATKPCTSKIGIVVDYGIIIAQDVIDYFPLGIVNSHFSLLPEWRGADPITFSLLSGQQQTGVSLMLIVARLDEGDIIAQAPLDISPDFTTPLLTDKLIELSNDLLIVKLPLYYDGQIKPYSQEGSSEATYSRKLTKADGVLDFSKPAQQLEREVRAYQGWPGSRTIIGDKDVIITAAHVLNNSASDPNEPGNAATTTATPATPGSLWRTGKEFGIWTVDGKVLVIDRLKPAGKAEMAAEAFLAGYKVPTNPTDPY